MGEVKARTLKRAGAWRQQLKQRPWRSAATGELLMALFMLPYQLRITCLGAALPNAMGPFTSLVKRMPHRFVYSPTDGGIFVSRSTF